MQILLTILSIFFGSCLSLLAVCTGFGTSLGVNGPYLKSDYARDILYTVGENSIYLQKIQFLL